MLSEEISSLTKRQAEAVKKRVDTLNATLRKKQKQKEKHKADVRDIFTPAQVCSHAKRNPSSCSTNTSDLWGCSAESCRIVLKMLWKGNVFIPGGEERWWCLRYPIGTIIDLVKKQFLFSPFQEEP